MNILLRCIISLFLLMLMAIPAVSDGIALGVPSVSFTAAFSNHHFKQFRFLLRDCFPYQLNSPKC